MAEPQNDPFAFLSNLNEKQEAYANEIIEKSKKLGLDPRLSLALTYRESKFDPNAVGTSDWSDAGHPIHWQTDGLFREGSA